MDKKSKLGFSDPVEAELFLLTSVSRDEKLRVHQAFQLSAAALADEPNEWPTQVLARLRSVKGAAIKRVLESVVGQADGWLKPIVAPLIAAGGPIAKIINVGAPYDESRALIWSKDRRTITSFRNSSFRTWDLSLGREVRRLDLPIDWGRAAIADPPRRAVVMASQRQLLLVNLENGTADVIFSGGIIEGIAISANGARALTTSVPPGWDYQQHDWNGPRTLRLFDLERRLCVRTWQAHRAFISDLALSEDGSFLATASRDRTAQLIDLKKAMTLGSWRCAREVEAVALTPSGHRIAYVSRAGVLTVRCQNGNVVGRYTNCGAEPGCVAFSEKGNKIVVAMGGEVSVVDVRKATRFGPFAGTQPYQNSLAIDYPANHAITGETGNQLVLWDLSKMKKAESPGEWISGIWAGSDKTLVHHGSLSIWDYSTGERADFRHARRCEVAAAPSAGLWAVARWSSNGGGRIRLGKWGHANTEPLVESRELSRGMLPSMHFSRNGKRLVVPTRKSGFRVLELSTGRAIWQKRNLGLGGRPYLSPSGRYLFSCSYSGKVEIVDLDGRNTVQGLQLQPITGKVLFAHDDCVFIPQSNETVLLDWRKGSSTALCERTPSSISDDARWLVTVSISRKLTLWELPAGRRVATYTLDVPVLETALSPDGRFLIAGDQSGGVHILRREG